MLGTGYWGINHVRVFASLAECEVVRLCDGDSAALARAATLAPRAKLSASADEVFADPEVDAVVIATPATTHAELALASMAAGKHLLVEKPVALSPADAERLEAAHVAAEVVFAVGHLMLHHPVMGELKRLIGGGELGDLYYLHSTRVNLGRLRRDENALWSFGPHDLSMIDFLMDELPTSVAARGACYLQRGVEDVVFLNLRFRGGQTANVHLSWLHPRKERRFTVIGAKKMVEFDDMAAEKLRIYDKGYNRPPGFTDFAEYLTIRQGDIHIPHVAMNEPLKEEALDFLRCVKSGAAPVAGLEGAIRIVKVLAAAQSSLDADGAPMTLD